jgi:hypothetical protein
MSTVVPKQYTRVLNTFQFNEKVMRYLQQQIEFYLEEDPELDRLQMEECNPDLLDHHPIVTMKLDRLKDSLYTNREALVTWFQDLARSLQQSQETTFPVKLELNREGHYVNWKECRFGFVVKECVSGIMMKAKRRVMGLPRLEPEEGYRTGFVLSVYFTEKLLGDFPFYKFYCASKLRDKYPAVVASRRAYYMTHRTMRMNSLVGQSPHPLLQGQPMYQLVTPSSSSYGAGAGGGGGGGAGAGGQVQQKEKSKPLQSMLAKRVLSYELERNGLRCPICLESESLSKESCIMFNCSHYVCEECYPSLEGRLCPMCRKQIKVSSD